MKARSLKIVVLSLIAVALCSCVGNRKARIAFDSADSLMQSHPDSALSILRTVDRASLSNRSDIARYSLLMSQALDKEGIESDSDSLTKIAYDYYRHLDDDRNHALAAYYHGRIAQNAGDNEHAASLFLEAKDYSEKNGDFITVGLSSNKLGDLYYNAVVFDKSLECYSASRSAFISAAKYEFADYEREMMASTMLQLKQYVEAAKEYEGCIDSAYARKDTAYASDLLCKEAFAYYLIPEYSKAIELYRKGIAGLVNDAQSTKYKTELAVLLMSEGKDRDAEELLLPVLSDTSLDYKAIASYNLYKIYKGQGRLSDALEMYEQFNLLSNSLFTRRLKDNLAASESKYDKSRLEFANYRLQQKRKTEVLCLLIIILALSITVASAIFAIRRKNEDIQEYCRVVKDLSISNDRLSAMLDEKDISEKHLKDALGKRINAINRIAAISYQYSENDKVLMSKKIDEVLKIGEKDSELFDDLYAVVNTRFDGALDTLKQKYGKKLTRKDISICCLESLGFKADEICALFSEERMTPNTVYRRRARIKEIFGISNGDSLNAFLESISKSAI